MTMNLHTYACCKPYVSDQISAVAHPIVFICSDVRQGLLLNHSGTVVDLFPKKWKMHSVHGCALAVRYIDLL